MFLTNEKAGTITVPMENIEFSITDPLSKFTVYRQLEPLGNIKALFLYISRPETECVLLK